MGGVADRHYREAECMRVEMEELLYAYGVDVVFPDVSDRRGCPIHRRYDAIGFPCRRARAWWLALDSHALRLREPQVVVHAPDALHVEAADLKVHDAQLGELG